MSTAAIYRSMEFFPVARAEENRIFLSHFQNIYSPKTKLPAIKPMKEPNKFFFDVKDTPIFYKKKFEDKENQAHDTFIFHKRQPTCPQNPSFDHPSFPTLDHETLKSIYHPRIRSGPNENRPYARRLVPLQTKRTSTPKMNYRYAHIEELIKCPRGILKGSEKSRFKINTKRFLKPLKKVTFEGI